MFKQLAEHLDKVNIVITLMKKDDKITYSIQPTAKDKKSDLGIVPLVGTATAEELDEQMPDIIAKSFGANKEVIANIADFAASLQKKVEDNKTKAATPTTTPSKVVPPAKPKEPELVRPPKANKAENKAYDELMKFIDQARDRVNDPDVFNFLKKQALTKGAEIKSAKDIDKAIEKEFSKIQDNYNERKNAEPATDGLFAEATVVEDSKTASQLIKEAREKGNEVTMADINKAATETAKVETKPAAPVVDPFTDITVTTEPETPTTGIDPLANVSITTEEDEDDDTDEEDDTVVTDNDDDQENTSAAPQELDIF